MVGSRQPEDFVSRHPFPAGKDILQDGVQGMPHMQRTGYIRRRNDERIGITCGFRAGRKISL
jgi:hypothetical protein